jgi:hypothetical protein
LIARPHRYREVLRPVSNAKRHRPNFFTASRAGIEIPVTTESQGRRIARVNGLAFYRMSFESSIE